jgi:hypothetical protein
MAGYSALDIQTLQSYINGANAALAAGDDQNALNYVELYYNAQTDIRGYAVDALHVVTDSGIDGVTAKQDVANAIGAAQWSSISTSVAVQLATADFQVITQNPSSVPTSNEIANYHATVFADNNIPITAWGGAAAAAMGRDWSNGTLNLNELAVGGNGLRGAARGHFEQHVRAGRAAARR